MIIMNDNWLLPILVYEWSFVYTKLDYHYAALEHLPYTGNPIVHYLFHSAFIFSFFMS